MRESILEVEHNPGEEEIIVHFRPPKMLLPPSTRTHLRAAEKEALLALRSLIDAAIETIEEKEKGERKERINIEVK